MNQCIINKKPQKFEELSVEAGSVFIDGKAIVEVEDIYVCFYCEELRNITILIKNEQVYNVTIIAKEINKFTKFLYNLQQKLTTVRFSQQDKKINGYAAAIAEKLREGIEVGIVDAAADTRVKCCPVCGMECDPSIPYCMECGEPV